VVLNAVNIVLVSMAGLSRRAYAFLYIGHKGIYNRKMVRLRPPGWL
jgi:hypothetical protein